MDIMEIIKIPTFLKVHSLKEFTLYMFILIRIKI